jgi:Spy/CpxP family protein refolding chaperone
MRLNLLTALLVLSLLLNGFFLGGYWFARFKADKVSSSEQRIGEIVRQLDLTPEQKSRFRMFKSRAINIRKSYLKRMAKLRSLFWKTVTSNSRGGQDIDRIIHEMAVERENYQKRIAGIISEFLHGLSREQKRKFFEISHDNRILKVLLSG